MVGVRLGDVTDDPSYAVAMMIATQLKWRVLPLNGKRPIIDDWQREATTDTQVIIDWWSWYTHADVGIATGPDSGIWVLDLDVKNGVDGAESLANIAAGRELPETFTVRSLSGRGLHLYWSWPNLSDDEVIKNSNGRLGPCIDVKGECGQVRAPHKVADILDGRWPVPAPEWLVEEIVKTSSVAEFGDVSRPTDWTNARTAVVDAAAKLALIKTGSRNDRLNKYAWMLSALSREIGIERDDAFEALMFACKQNGLWADEPEQCRVTFASGWNAGQALVS